MKTKYSKGAVSKKIWAIFLVLFAFFFVLVIVGGIVRSISGDNSLTLASMIKRLINRESIVQNGGTVTESLLAENSRSSAKLFWKDKKNKLNLSPINSSKWPENAAGGLYELMPDGEFEEGVEFQMTLKEAPPADFALGYWHPETKKWEWLPTAKISDKTFQTVLPHATEIGGASGGACSTPPKDPENVAMTNAVAAEMRQVQIEQQTGKVSPDDEKQWKKAWDNAKELTDKAINDYCNNRNTNTQYDFYAAWELAQCLGFQTLNQRFVNAWENDCQEKEKVDAYQIDQKDDYTGTLNLDFASFYKINSTHKGTIHYSGSQSGKSVPGKPAWRTDWKVYQFVNSTSLTNQKGHLEGDVDEYHTDWDINAANTAGTASDVGLFVFSLENVKEGESFLVTFARAGEYYSRMAGPDATFRLHTIHTPSGVTVKDERMNASMNSEMKMTSSPTFYFSAVLTKDLGEAGAILDFSAGEMKLTAEQKKDLQRAKDVMKGTDLAQIGDIFTESGEINKNSSAYKSQGEMKPWRIFKAGEIREDEPEENDWKDAQDDLDATRKKANNQQKMPNPDEDGDGIPDLVPLPGN